MGVYNTSQSLGLFFGGAMGGVLSQHFGYSAVYEFGAGMIALWLLAAIGMKTPPAVKTRLFHLGKMEPDQAQLLKTALQAIEGVYEAGVIAEEQIAILKVLQSGWNEPAAIKLLEESTHGIGQ